MLSELKVSNLALIKCLTLSFGTGANILTGETGAGKSILAGALSLLRGAKGSSELIRAGASEAKIEALFHLERPADLAHLFEELSLEPQDELIVQRVISSTGRTKIRVNGALATLNQLAALGEELLAISGQHDQQSLVKESKQLDFLDAFGRHQSLLADMAEAFRERDNVEKRLALLEKQIKDGLQLRDLWEFQLSEIQKIAPKPNEDAELMDLKASRKSSEKLSKAFEEINAILLGFPDGLLDKAARLSRLLTRTSSLDERLEPLAEKAEDCAANLEEISQQLDKLKKTLNLPQDQAEDLEERLSQLAKLKRKYGPDLQDVVAKAEHNKASLASLESAESEKRNLEKLLSKSVEKTSQAALKLREARLISAKSLTENLTATLKVLGFPKLTMKIDLEPLERDKDPGLSANLKGADLVSFLFCPNPGEGLKPVSKIASGGELSRVMMALKIAQEPRSDQSLVFDEIDSGLSGATAEAVAVKMGELAARQQIFVITHLAQMASLPGRHFLIAKNQDETGDRTETIVSELDQSLRAMELARLLDGASPSPEALALSRRLLKQ
ncbi:MAG: DNA repair protein RecN [Deltaproteobacteria bacterium]|jgi:DNA repair protein RecN (Recombination protein N)|nr:DNA repair protein RecN [Deltaproteobacteria bacterium]